MRMNHVLVLGIFFVIGLKLKVLGPYGSAVHDLHISALDLMECNSAQDSAKMERPEAKAKEPEMQEANAKEAWNGDRVARSTFPISSTAQTDRCETREPSGLWVPRGSRGMVISASPSSLLEEMRQEREREWERLKEEKKARKLEKRKKKRQQAELDGEEIASPSSDLSQQTNSSMAVAFDRSNSFNYTDLGFSRPASDLPIQSTYSQTSAKPPALQRRTESFGAASAVDSQGSSRSSTPRKVTTPLSIEGARQSHDRGPSSAETEELPPRSISSPKRPHSSELPQVVWWPPEHRSDHLPEGEEHFTSDEWVEHEYVSPNLAARCWSGDEAYSNPGIQLPAGHPHHSAISKPRSGRSHTTQTPRMQIRPPPEDNAFETPRAVPTAPEALSRVIARAQREAKPQETSENRRRDDTPGSNNAEQLSHQGTMTGFFQIAVCFLVSFSTLGVMLSYGAIQGFYEFVLLHNTSPVRITAIGTLQISFLFCLTGPIHFILRINKLACQIIFHVGSAIAFVSIFVTGNCTEWSELLAVQGILLGIGIGMAFGSSHASLSAYLENKTGLALVASLTGAHFGGITFSTMLKYRLNATSFTWSIRDIAIVIGIALTLANIGFRARTPHQQRSAGTQQSGSEHSSSAQRKSIFDIYFIFVSLGFLLVTLGLFMPYYYIVTFGVAGLYLPGAKSIDLLIAMITASPPGHISSFLISRRCGPFNVILGFLVSTSIFAFLFLAFSRAGYGGTIAYSICYGFSSSGVLSVLASTIEVLTQKNDGLEQIRRGIVFTTISIAGLFGNMASAGILQVSEGRFLYMQLFAAICITLGTMLLVLVRMMNHSRVDSRA